MEIDNEEASNEWEEGGTPGGSHTLNDVSVLSSDVFFPDDFVNDLA